MRGTEIYQLAGSVASQATSHLNNVFYEEYHKEMDNMFARLHAEQEINKEGMTKKEYKEAYREKVDEYISNRHSKDEPQKYERLEFTSKAEANTFAKSMQEQGFNVINPSISINGKYLMEVQTEIPKKDDSGNQVRDARGNLETVSVHTAMYNATEQTGIEAKRYSYDEDSAQNRLSDKPEEAMGNETAAFFRKEMLGGELGAVVNAVERFDRISRKYGDENQAHAFTVDLVTSGGEEKATAQWSGANRKQEQATVLNNGIVIINGNIVEDEKTIQKVLNLHEERMSLADKHQKRFEEDSVINQLRFSSTNEKIKENTKAIQESVRRQSYATGERKSGRFDGGILDNMRDSYGTAAIALRQNSGRMMSDELLTVLNKAEKKINLSNTEKEFIAKLNAKATKGETIELSYDDVINTANIIKRAENRDSKKPFLEDNELKLIKELSREEKDGGTFVLNKSELRMVGGGQVKRELDAIREDLGVDLRFREIHGSNLTALQLTHINKDLESKLATAGITYDESKGKFIKDGKELDKYEFYRELEAVDPKLAKDFEQGVERKGYKIKEDGSFVHARKGITEDDILKLDRAFIAKAEVQGYNFITAAGQFDVKSLQKLSDADLAKIGISKETRDILVKFHSDKWGGHNFDLTKGMVGGFSNITMKLAAGNKFVEGDRETAEAINAYQKIAQMPNHVKEAARYTKQATEAARLKVNAFKEKHYKSGKGNANAKTPTKPNKKVDAAKRKSNKKKSEKYLSRQEARMLRKARSEKFWKPFNQLRQKLDVKERFIKWFSNTGIGKVIFGGFNAVKGFLIKIVATFLGGYALLGGGIIAVVIIISMIQALLNLPYEGMKALVSAIHKDEHPAIMELYQYLNDLQDPWVESLSNYQSFYDSKESLNYTYKYMSYSNYITALSSLKLKDLKATNDAYHSILFEDSGTLYINPFYGVSKNNVPTENFTAVTSFNGKNRTDILANPSEYGKKVKKVDSNGNEDAVDVEYSSIESGHTNNIKDILSMVDVMYQFDINKFGDDELESILGEKPSVINFENSWNQLTGTVREAGKVVKEVGVRVYNAIAGWIGTKKVKEEKFPTWEEFWDNANAGTVSYATIQSYCNELWKKSHQEQVSLDVEFYPITSFSLTVDEIPNVPVISPDMTKSDKRGKNTTGLDISQEIASWLDGGICTSPVTSNFKIKYDGKIFPYLMDNGTVVDLSTATYNNKAAINITMQNCIEENLCLWSSMSSNESTWNDIQKDDCWEKGNNIETPVPFSSSNLWNPNQYYPGELCSEETANNAGYGWTLESAKKLAYEKYKIAVDDEFEDKKYETVYALDGTGRNWITKTSYKKAIESWENYNYYDIDSSQQRKYKSGSHKEDWQCYGKHTFDSDGNENGITNTNSRDENGGRKLWRVGVKDANGNKYINAWVVSYSTDDIDLHTEDDGDTLVWYTSYNGYKNRRTEKISDEYTGNYWTFVEPITYEVTVDDYSYETVYRVMSVGPNTEAKTKTGYAIKQTIERYNRNCKGHPFTYCGGHICCHVKGVTYSTTNEQLAAAGMYQDEDMIPQAIYNSDGSAYSLKDAGYDPLKGKVNKKEVDYSTLSTAISTGGANYVYLDPQGVGKNVSDGLNLYVVGDELGKDFHYKDVKMEEVRDIFDVDCIIEKGKNIFPWKLNTKDGKTSEEKKARWKQYEGWTADNMQFVAMRVSTDWNDLYNFDIPMEIGGTSSLSEDDIKEIINALKEKYGDKFTEERENAVKLALHWVGKGHYSKEHLDHDFLREVCAGHEFHYDDSRGHVGDSTIVGNCTASTGQGFVNFYLEKNGKKLTSSSDSSLWYSSTSYINAKPGDLYRQNFSNSYLKAFSFSKNELDGKSSWLKTYLEIVGSENEVYGIYIGTLDKEIYLDNGQVINSGVPITVDLSPTQSLYQYNPDLGNVEPVDVGCGAGSVWLRTGTSSVYGDKNSENNYKWFTDTGITKKFSNFDKR